MQWIHKWSFSYSWKLSLSMEHWGHSVIWKWTSGLLHHFLVLVTTGKARAFSQALSLCARISLTIRPENTTARATSKNPGGCPEGISSLHSSYLLPTMFSCSPKIEGQDLQRNWNFEDSSECGIYLWHWAWETSNARQGAFSCFRASAGLRARWGDSVCHSAGSSR